MSYPKVTRERAVEFLVCLRHLADYVILDCTSVFEADVFSILAMEMADRVLRVGTSNLRGISYFKSHAGMLEGRADNGKYISAIGNFKTGQEWEAAAGQYGGVGFVFPYVAELEKQYDEASLWNGLTSKEASPFRRRSGKCWSKSLDCMRQNRAKTSRGQKKETGSAQPLCLEKQGRILSRRKRIAGNIKHT